MFETDETLIRRILQGKDREAGELLVERCLLYTSPSPRD